LKEEQTKHTFIISLRQDKILSITGWFFLLVGICFGSALGGILFLKIISDVEWWDKLFTMVLIGTFLFFPSKAFLRGFLWLAYGKEKITLSSTEFIVERTGGFFHFQKHIVPYHTISDISLSNKIDYFEYTGKAKTGVLRIKYDKDNNIGFGGRKINETISTIYHIILNKSKIQK
jgi:hypothetical protein